MCFNFENFSDSFVHQMNSAPDLMKYLKKIKEMPNVVFYEHIDDFNNRDLEPIIDSVRSLIKSMLERITGFSTNDENVNKVVSNTKIMNALLQHLSDNTKLRLIYYVNNIILKTEPVVCDPLKEHAIRMEYVPPLKTSSINSPKRKVKSTSSKYDSPPKKNKDDLLTVAKDLELSDSDSDSVDFVPEQIIGIKNGVKSKLTDSEEESDSEDLLANKFSDNKTKEYYKKDSMREGSEFSTETSNKLCPERTKITLRESVSKIEGFDHTQLYTTQKLLGAWYQFTVKLVGYSAWLQTQFVDILDSNMEDIQSGRAISTHFPFNMTEVNKKSKGKRGRPSKTQNAKKKNKGEQFD